MAGKQQEKLKVHPSAEVWPMMTDSEFRVLKDSVRETGIVQPIISWKDAAGDEWLMAGRKRQKAYCELVSEGLEYSLNGNPLTMPVQVFEGTEVEAIDFARAADNGARKNSSSIQRAATAVLFLQERRKAEARLKGVSLSELPESYLESGMAEQISQEWDTNRSYVFLVQRCARKSKKILNAILDGEINGNEAGKAIARVERGLDPFPKEGEDDGAASDGAVEGEKPPEVFDGLKQLVEPDLVPIFASRDNFKAVVKKLKEVRVEVESLGDGPGGKFVPVEELKNEIGNLISSLNETMPHCPCPMCSGTGDNADPEVKGKKCKTCKGARYVDKTQYKILPDDVKVGQEAAS